MHTDFEYFYFQPLKPSHFFSAFLDKYSLDEQTARICYQHWLGDYCRKAYLFYTMQHRRHIDMFYKKIKEEFDIDEEYVDDYHEDTLKRLRETEGIGLRERELEYQLEHLSLLQSQYLNTALPHQNFRSIREIVDDLRGWLEFRHAVPNPTISEAYALWFNNLIHNDSDTKRKLRALPYESYLRTSHWKRVRSAILLANRASCQALDCQYVGESWYGGHEVDLHVHHLNYENRGNERFEDLALLCKWHHESWHKNPNSVEIIATNEG